jgi:hypothetical protein
VLTNGWPKNDNRGPEVPKRDERERERTTLNGTGAASRVFPIALTLSHIVLPIVLPFSLDIGEPKGRYSGLT